VRLGTVVDIDEFYDADERRRNSKEVELGDSWNDKRDPDVNWEVSWIADTGELYGMREVLAGGEKPTVKILGKASQRDELERILDGWQEIMREPDSLAWLQERLGRSESFGPVSVKEKEGEKIIDGPRSRPSDSRFAELDKLASEELHDRAVHLAEKHLDVKFFWDLLKDIPAAEAVAGNLQEADKDVLSASRQLTDAMGSDKADLVEALRPVYIDYLLNHQPLANSTD
jgi:hypothetical protein